MLSGLARVKRDSGCFFKHEIHMQGIEWENDLARICFLQYSGIQQGLHIAMYRFNIPSQTARQFSDSHWSRAGHTVQHFPPFAGEYLE